MPTPAAIAPRWPRSCSGPSPMIGPRTFWSVRASSLAAATSAMSASAVASASASTSVPGPAGALRVEDRVGRRRSPRRAAPGRRGPRARAAILVAWRWRHAERWARLSLADQPPSGPGASRVAGSRAAKIAALRIAAGAQAVDETAGARSVDRSVWVMCGHGSRVSADDRPATPGRALRPRPPPGP